MSGAVGKGVRAFAVALAGAGMVLSAVVGHAIAQVKPGEAELVAGLRSGGYVLVMRNPSAEPDKADRDPLNFKNIRAQQQLSADGRQEAINLGNWLRQLGVPVGEVLTSRFNRCLQTALLAGFKQAKPVAELTEGSLVESPNENRRRAAVLRQLVATAVEPGANRLLVTHRANITQAFGKEWYDVREGEISIFKPEMGAYTLAGRLQLADWGRLAASLKP
jgi:phosphohistidine phosphatase SixA